MDLITSVTEDRLRLIGFHWPGSETLVVFIHGMAGCIQEHHFTHELGATLSAKGIGFLYTHNRGYGTINDILIEPDDEGAYSFKRCGASYERFGECLHDIRAWLATARSLGYSHIILMGHSLGCNKILHYISCDQNCQHDLDGIIFAAAPDVVAEGQQSDMYTTFAKKAKRFLAEDNPDALLGIFDDDIPMSAGTFCDIYLADGPADNLPLRHRPDSIASLTQVRVPVFSVLGTQDHIIVHSAREDLELIEKHLINAPYVNTQSIEGTDHIYAGREETFAHLITDWISGHFPKNR